MKKQNTEDGALIEYRALNPTLDVIQKVAEALEVSATELIGAEAVRASRKSGQRAKCRRRLMMWRAYHADNRRRSLSLSRLSWRSTSRAGNEKDPALVRVFHYAFDSTNSHADDDPPSVGWKPCPKPRKVHSLLAILAFSHPLMYRVGGHELRDLGNAETQKHL